MPRMEDVRESARRIGYGELASTSSTHCSGLAVPQCVLSPVNVPRRGRAGESRG
jgi:hypothetical protein